MDRAQTIEAIKQAALAEGIDPELYLAICTIESSLNPYALKFEWHYKWTTHPRDWGSRFYIDGETERAFQSFSYGASQVMGSVMRDMGYDKHLMFWHMDPEAPIKYGAKHLKRFLIRSGSEEAAVASYNAGSPRKTLGGMFENQAYVDKVFKELRRLRALV